MGLCQEYVLCREPVIAYPRSHQIISLILDAATQTEEEKGTIFCKTDDKGDPNAYILCQQKIANQWKELHPLFLKMQATCWGMNHFSTFLILYTDHKPLEKMGKVRV